MIWCMAFGGGCVALLVGMFMAQDRLYERDIKKAQEQITRCEYLREVVE